MNRENVKLLRDTLAAAFAAGRGFRRGRRRYGFNMRAVSDAAAADKPDHLDSCNTVCCLAGWTRLIRGGTNMEDIGLTDESNWLGLSNDEASALFKPLETILLSDSMVLPWATITVPEALLVLDNLLATGEVDWSIIITRREKIRTNGYVPVSPVYGRPEQAAP